MLSTTEKFKSRAVRKVPDSLVYEIMDGEPLYYRGYRDVLAGKKTLEEIMGSSSLQALIVEYFNGILFAGLDRRLYRIFSSEAGIHLDHRNNLTNDVAVYEKSVLPATKINKKYADVPCRLAIEVDVKADLSNPKDYNYVQRKTQKLLDFGTEKVVWVFTETRKVMVASKGENWQTMDWNKEIYLLDGLAGNIGGYLAEEGVQLENDD